MFCVCMFLYMSLFACVFVCVCVHTFSISVISSLNWYVCVCMFLYMSLFACVFVCVCMHAFSISVISSLLWCVCVCMFLYMFLFACVFVCVCVHAFSISVISSLTWCTKSGWGRLGRQPISRPPQYLEQYAGNNSAEICGLVQNTGCLKKLSFARLSIWRSCCHLGWNTYDIRGKSANAQFGKTHFFRHPVVIPALCGSKSGEICKRWFCRNMLICAKYIALWYQGQDSMVAQEGVIWGKMICCR